MNIIKYSKFYIALSLVVLIPGVIALAKFGLNLAIDFTGGSVFEYQLTGQNINKDEVSAKIKQVFTSKSVTVETLTFSSDNRVTVRTKPVDVNDNEPIKSDLTKAIDGISQVAYETVGPSVGNETTKNSLVAIALASVGILLYIAFVFRNVPKPYSSLVFGACAIIAMLHDIFVVLGIFSVLGHFYKVEIDALFITAMLTVIGFSVHDTIVVFDRVRENLRKLPATWSFAEIVNYSLVETLNRSLATSLTVIMTLSALFVLGGESIKNFVLALLIGIISGTYSSIFNASPILVYWEEWLAKRKTSKKR